MTTRSATVVGLLGWISLCLSSYAATLPAAAPASNQIDVAFPLPQFNREYAAQAGNPQPTAGRLLIYLPAQFDPRRSWPLFVINATADRGRTSIMDAPWYRSLTADGCVVLATDANIRPRTDTVPWRIAVLSAALNVMHRDWPASRNWPAIFAGISGGAKRAEWNSAILAETRSVRIAGMFLAGINDDRMPEALQSFHPPPEFRNVPIWISSGRNDPIAKPEAARDVRNSLVHLGFRNVRMGTFNGGHEVDRGDLRDALRWFKTLGKF